MELRDNLLVTMGARAAYMHDRGDIELPSGVEGEKTIAEFVARAVSTYITYGNIGLSVNFDEFSEGILKKQYGVEKDVKDVTDDDFDKLTVCMNSMLDEIKKVICKPNGIVYSADYAMYKAIEYLELQILELDKRMRKC